MSEYDPTFSQIRESWSFQQAREHDWTVDTARELFDAAVAVREAKVRADQIEKDAVIAEHGSGVNQYESLLGAPHIRKRVADAIRAQLIGPTS